MLFNFGPAAIKPCSHTLPSEHTWDKAAGVAWDTSRDMLTFMATSYTCNLSQVLTASLPPKLS